MNTKKTDSRYVASTYARFPVEIAGGSGSVVWDETGKKYIDLGSGIAVNTFGVCDEKWKAAVTAQLDKFQHTSNLFYSAPCANLARLLCKKTGMEKVFFSNSGAEANECAIKTARKWAGDTYGDGRHTIITLKGSFHGRTLATLAATGQDSFHTDFGPFPEGFVYADPSDPDSLERLADQNGCCAIMFEVIQGEGGVVPLSAEFISKMTEVARKYGLLLIADEVQTGNGRTGKMCAYMHYNLKPDIVTTAKGLGGGLPIGATLFSARTANTLTKGTHGSTFGGNPAAAAGALSIVSRINDRLLGGVETRSRYIRSALEGAKGVRSLTGMGLMLGIETEKPAAELIAACRERGVLVLSAKNKVRLLPALNIPLPLLSRAIKILKEVL